MQGLTDVHQQFAEFFNSETLKPFAYLVSKKLSEGHICLNLDELSESEMNLPFSGVKEMVDLLAKEPLVTVLSGEKQPFVLHRSKLYLHRYFAYETMIVKRIHQFLVDEKPFYDERIAQLEHQRTFIKQLFGDGADDSALSSQERVDWQLVAALLGVLHNFTIITGGPGTGKTTIVAKLLVLLFRLQPELKVALAAPTGKAANRMAESLKSANFYGDEAIKEKFQSLQPNTLHRLLKPRRDSPYFEHDITNPLKEDLVIVDEASMVDVALFAKLLNAIGPKTRLLLLGDKDQLASVEAGSLLGDLCLTQSRTNTISSEKINFINSFIVDQSRIINDDFFNEGSKHPLEEHIIELKRSYRFSSAKGIGKLSKAIITNDVDNITKFLLHMNDDQILIDTHYHNMVFDHFVAGYEEYIYEMDIKAALQKFNQLRILCAIRGGIHGIHEINKRVEGYLANRGLLDLNTEFYLHRPIMITRNYYDLGLFNGDIGIIRPDENGVMKAWFEDYEKGLKSVIPAFISESETVFAMTIHKSQGSEYNHVLAILPEQINASLLTRELLYTAVTRAKLTVSVQASEAVILQTALGKVKRASGIIDRFEEQQNIAL